MQTDPIKTSIDKAIQSHLIDLNTSIPAYVQDYDPEKKTITAIVAYSDFTSTDGAEPTNLDWVPIGDVPVQFKRGGGFSETYELVKGDPVLLIFAQRSIDEWFGSDGKTEITPKTQQTHNENDCFALAGLFPTKNNSGRAEAGRWIISHVDESVALILDKSGKGILECNRFEIGDEGASTAVVVDKSLLGLGSWLSDATILINAMGGILGLIPATYPPLIPPDITSSKAFTND